MKRLSRDKKWRHVYPYTCTGCGKKRIAFAHERAQLGKCTHCEPVVVDKDQGRLFEQAPAGIRVLSLFDGISCARVALARAGIPVAAYYASEIDEKAIAVSKKNWPDIIQLGDVRGVGVATDAGGKQLYDFDIDLLIGGSPCQDLSRAKLNRQGLKGARSGLFYEYLRILKEVKPKWFVLENVASMARADRDEISRELGVQPIMIDAALVSAQSRKRFFWTNIPDILQPADRGILLKDVIEGGHPMGDKSRTIMASYAKGSNIKNLGTRFERTMVMHEPVRLGKLKGTKGGQSTRVYSMEGKSVPLQSQAGGGRSENRLLLHRGDGTVQVREATRKGFAIAEEGDSIDMSFPNSTTRRGRVGKKAKSLMTSTHIHVFQRGDVRPLTAVECERLQSLPDGYTDILSKTARITVLGNAFNVEVIAHILGYIKGR